MGNDPHTSDLLEERSAYQDKENPVLLASGKIGIHYSNTEKLSLVTPKLLKIDGMKETPYVLMDKIVDSIREDHIDGLQDPKFLRVIETLAERVDSLRSTKTKPNFAISGGQTRDWVFSGPVAMMLEYDLITLFKDGKTELVTRDGGLIEEPDLSDYHVVHIADLMTTGSSAYDPRKDPPTGWIPMLRNRGATITDMFNVVTRQEGGEEALALADVIPHYLVAIDQDFIRDHSKFSERGLAYKEDPDAWCRNYLTEHGALEFVSYFDPDGNGLKKASNFLQEYDTVLRESGRGAELEREVHEAYGMNFEDLFGGR
jgi:orotate phosphoribosyltransferase